MALADNSPARSGLIAAIIVANDASAEHLRPSPKLGELEQITVTRASGLGLLAAA